MQRGCCGWRFGNQLSFPKDFEPRGPQPNRFNRVARLQHYEARVATRLKPITFEMHHFRGIGRHRVEAASHAVLACHLRDVQAHVCDFQHVA